MSALTRRDHRRLLPELLEWLQSPYAVLHSLASQTMRAEEGVEDNRFVVRAEMPGINPEKQAEVSLSKGVLTLHAERTEDMDSPHRSEFRYGSFQRRVILPANANEGDIVATYDKGIIEVSVGLKASDQAEETGRTIPVMWKQHIDPT
jgi:HSP20 family protein